MDNLIKLPSGCFNESNKYLQGAAQNVPVSWIGHKVASNKCARGWLIFGVAYGDGELSHFQKIVASNKPVLYLTGDQDTDAKHYIRAVDDLPKHVLDDRIFDNYHGCKAGDTVSDIIACYKRECGKVYLGEVDLPKVYEFSALLEKDYFQFIPAARNLKSDCSSDYISSFTNFDFYWETSAWNVFTTRSYYRVSLMLPNYEVDSKIRFSRVLEELMLLPPNERTCFPGGTIYKESENDYIQRDSSYYAANIRGEYIGQPVRRDKSAED